MSAGTAPRKSTARDMTQGPILLQIILFSLPLLLGNLFQLFYNTVDTLVVGNFVGTQALAAVGSTTMIVNIVVFFFAGLSIGAGVIISQRFGAKEMDALHTAIETTMMMTFLLGILFTVLGVLAVPPMLQLMSTPADVIPEATVYLRIYFAGISGLMIYNMGSGILRSVGDTTRPLYFLILTSLVNIVLDLFFVLVLKMGIAGVALATIISQFLSALLVIRLLCRTEDVYRLTWHDLSLDPSTFRSILNIGLPTAFQSMLTSFSNVFVQSYINVFGSACMAGWSCYNKLDMFIMLPMSSVSSAATTFVSQNVGAKQKKRVNQGTVLSLVLTLAITGAILFVIIVFAEPASRLFTSDDPVVAYSVKFIRLNCIFLLFNTVNHVLAGALRGRGDSKGPMLIMLLSFVAIRQLYLFGATRLIGNTETVVALGYPVGWVTCCVIEVAYYLLRVRRAKEL